MILLMGIAGSGKGTQGNMLAEQKGMRLVSMGDAVRQYANPEQRERMLAGELLKDEEVIEILNTALDSGDSSKEVLLDGFPRTIPQAEWLLAQAKTGRFQLEAAIHLVAGRQAVKERLLQRARIDDKEDAIEARFDEYERATAPLLDWLSDHGVKVLSIDAERSIDEVNQDIVAQLR